MKVQPEQDLVSLKVEARLIEEDYDQVLPEIERLIDSCGALRFIVDVTALQAVEPKALLRDILFDLKHREAYRRVAMIGDRTWQQWVTTLSQPLVGGDMKYFRPEQREEAENWVRQDRADA